MQTIVGALLIAFAVLGAGRGISRSIYRSAIHMSEAITTSLDRLTSDVSTVITDVATALRDAASGSTDTTTADAINAQAQRLEDFDATLKTPAIEPTPGEPSPEPTPETSSEG